MKKQLLLLLITPLALVSCSSNKVSFAKFNEKVQGIEDTTQYPYYKVIGSLDFNAEVIEVNATFDQTPGFDTFVPYSRYNEGFYCKNAGDGDDPDDVVIYGMASRSYWLRAPMRIHKDNFYVVDEKGNENMTCAHYFLSHLITSWMDSEGSLNPSSSYVYYELLSNGGFVIGGDKVHTSFILDNYPYYPDPVAHPELFGPWSSRKPRPAYQSNINAKVNVRFEYDAEGWLRKEYLASIDYDYRETRPSQISLIAEYFYKFSD